MTEMMTRTSPELDADIEIPEALTKHKDQIRQTLAEVGEKLERGTEFYRGQIQQLRKQSSTAQSHNGRSNGGSAEIAGPIAVFGGVPYSFFDLLAVGPFQPTGGGALRPSQIIRSGDPAFLIAAVWRNPEPLAFDPSNPSAAQIMAGQRYAIRGQTVNVNQVVSGPDLGPVFDTFGAGFFDLHVLPIPNLPTPPADGAPVLLDITLTIDVASVANGLPPFAGYASVWRKIEDVPPFVIPFIPGVGGGPIVVPGSSPSFVQDIPVRVLVFT